MGVNKPDFSVDSHFAPGTGFTSIRFGSGAKILECELNEMQYIQEEARCELIRDLTPSGFISLPEIEWDSSKLQMTIGPSVAYVYGYRIPVAQITAKLDTDTMHTGHVFLKVTKAHVTPEDTINAYGGGKSIPNSMKDSRINAETSHRIQLKYEVIIDSNEFAFGRSLDDIGIQVPMQGQTENVWIIPIATMSADSPSVTDKRLLISLSKVVSVEDASKVNVAPGTIVIDGNGIMVGEDRYMKASIVKTIPEPDEMKEDTLYLVAEGGDA